MLLEIKENPFRYITDTIQEMIQAKTKEELEPLYHKLVVALETIGETKSVKTATDIYSDCLKKLRERKEDKLDPIFSEILNNFKGATK